MFVRNWMRENPITIAPDTLVIDAKKIMSENDVRHLPVTEDGRLVGMVSQNLLREAKPSAATSLSIHELNYLLAKMKVADIMSRDMVTCGPDITLEEASVIGTRHKIGALPVVDNNRLVGIITETDLYRAFLHMVGANKVPSTRVTVDDFPKEQDALVTVINILDELNLTLSNLALVDDVPIYGRRELVMRISEGEVGTFRERMEAAGFTVSNVTTVREQLSE
ncbi:MAG: CBS domain-containing protein [Deltaproteobacteria bacterium]|nr:CBS domain-containing protein [Candidatus Anaeroferrophillacea bacterium]